MIRSVILKGLHNLKIRLIRNSYLFMRNMNLTSKNAEAYSYKVLKVLSPP